MLWWSKPLDVHDPTPVIGPRVEALCALMCMNSDIGRGATSFGKRSIKPLVPFEMDYLIRVDADDGLPVPFPTSETDYVSGKVTVSGKGLVSAETLSPQKVLHLVFSHTILPLTPLTTR